MKRLSIAALVAGCLSVAPATFASQLIAGVTVESVSSEYTLDPWDLRAVHVVDGSGLTGAGHDVTSPAGNSWQTSSATGTGTIVFDLGASYTLGSVHVWNLNFYSPYNGRGARLVRIRTSSNLLDWSDKGVHTFTMATGVAGDPGFDLDASTWGQARYVEFDILANFGLDDNAGHVGLSEVQFFAAAEPPPTYQLSVTKAGTGAGTVTSTTPAGVIDCGAACSATFSQGTQVTLSAAAALGSTFTGWTGGGCSGTGACIVTMNAAVAVTATFTLNTYTLTVSKAGTGSGTVSSALPLNAINCGTTCSATFDHRSVVDLIAVPAPGSVFTGWSGDRCAGGTGPCNVVMFAPVTLTATFTQTELLTLWKAGTGTGTVTVVGPAGTIFPDSGDCDLSCTGLSRNVTKGTAVTLSATPSPDSTFSGWSGACTGSGACNVVMDQERTVTAAFQPKPTSYTSYLAEGATSNVFDTRLALLNPGTSDSTATLTFLQGGKPPVVAHVQVSGRSRVTVNPKQIPGLATAEFSTSIESDQPLVVDRTMSWSDGQDYGAHAETAVAAPALVWYLAEGATHSSFDLFYLLQNPNAAEAQVRVRYLRPSGAPLERTYTLDPNSRTNIWVDYEEFPGLGPALAATDVSAVFEVLNAQPIIVERAMYADVPGQFFGVGHGSAGITAPAQEWFLAEGATGPFFDLFVLVANPGAVDAQVEATYLFPDGSTLVRPYNVAASSRFNIWVDYEDARLADTAVSTTIRSTNGVPIIVERSMWWPGNWTTWHEAHNSAGATTTGTRWALAEGEVNAARNLETYILVANTSTSPADVKVTLLFEDGASVERDYPGIPARSRFNVPVGLSFPEAAGKRFGAIVESLGAAPAQIVVERAMYWDAAGQGWAAGTNALATKLQ